VGSGKWEVGRQVEHYPRDIFPFYTLTRIKESLFSIVALPKINSYVRINLNRTNEHLPLYLACSVRTQSSSSDKILQELQIRSALPGKASLERRRGGGGHGGSHGGGHVGGEAFS
jgi:hypothetical protein